MPPYQIALLIFSILASSGALLFFFKYGTRLAFAEHDSTKALAKAEAHDRELATTAQRVTSMEATLGEIRASLSKLHLIDQINATCDVLKERLEDTRRDTAELKTDFKELKRELSANHSTL